MTEEQPLIVIQNGGLDARKEGTKENGWMDIWGGGRYATYWHRSTGGPIKDRMTFMAPSTAFARPWTADVESNDILLCIGGRRPTGALGYRCI